MGGWSSVAETSMRRCLAVAEAFICQVRILQPMHVLTGCYFQCGTMSTLYELRATDDRREAFASLLRYMLPVEVGI